MAWYKLQNGIHIVHSEISLLDILCQAFIFDLYEQFESQICISFEIYPNQI